MAENKQYITQAQENGTVMISEDVIATIVTHAVVDVEIVSSSGTTTDTYDMDRISNEWYLSESEFEDVMEYLGEEIEGFFG